MKMEQSDPAGANRHAVIEDFSLLLDKLCSCQLQNVLISGSNPICQAALAPNTWLTSVSFSSSSRFIDNFSKLWNCGGRFRTWWGWSKHHWVQTAACQPTPCPGKQRRAPRITVQTGRRLLSLPLTWSSDPHYPENTKDVSVPVQEPASPSPPSATSPVEAFIRAATLQLSQIDELRQHPSGGGATETRRTPCCFP